MKLKLELNGQVIELTMDEARKLYGELAQLFAKEVYPFSPLPQPQPYPVNPIEIAPYRPTWTAPWRPMEITC